VALALADREMVFVERRVGLADARRLGLHLGRGVVDDRGRQVAPGRPVGEALAEALERAGFTEVPVLIAGRSAGPDRPHPEFLRGRGDLLGRLMRASRNLRGSSALDAEHGRAAEEALALAIESFEAFPPLGELLGDRGLAPGFIVAALDAGVLAGITGAALGWPAEVLSDLVLSAVCADLGMLHLPAALTAKPGRLGTIERRRMERHAQLGSELLRPLAALCPLAPVVALQHHERWDGRGYPAGLSGAAIRPEAQVVAVAQRYLAAIRARPDRDAMAPHDAMELLLTLAGSIAAPAVVEALVGAVTAYPRGAMFRLSDGRTGTVQDPGRGCRPVVEVVWDERGQRIQGGEIVDLAADHAAFITAVAPSE
jgi:HD domain-containing protein